MKCHVAEKVLGAIDVGSNAIRMSIVAMAEDGMLRTLQAERVPVRLGTDAFTRGRLATRAIDAAVRALRSFRARFDANNVVAYRAVATSAVRSARNRDVLLHRVLREAGIDLQIIDGEEEARLVRKAALYVLDSSQCGCILDLGGGSLEVSLHMDGAWQSSSLPIGTVRLLESFNLRGALTDDDAALVRRFAATLISTLEMGEHSTKTRVAAILGGNADALATLVNPKAPTMPFSVVALEAVVSKIMPLPVAERMRRFGLRRDRADVIVIAGLIFVTVARQLGLTSLRAPGVGLRDALLLELQESATAAFEQAESDATKALLTAARQFARRAEHDTTHSEHVRVLARSLYAQLVDIHGIPPEHEITLEVAALLHDIGEVVNPKAHHKHSEYMILHGNISGLDDTRRSMIALAARCHRKSFATGDELLAHSTLPKAARDATRGIIALLRIADSLDFEHRQRVTKVVCTRQRNAIVIDALLSDRPTRNDSLLLSKGDWFRSVFGFHLRLIPASAERTKHAVTRRPAR